MRMKQLMALAAGTALLGLATGVRADNPIVQTIYTADPAPLVHDGVLYLYTTHDEDGSTWFTMNDWRCYSTTDMVNWTDHGVVFSLDDLSWANRDAWAPQATYRNGKFYFYVPAVRNQGGPAIGVGVSDSPTGPFTDPLGRPLAYTNHGDIDPSVFIDDDGQAYLYWGNPNLYYVKLNEDMISYEGEIQRVPMTTETFGVRSKDDRETSYEEAPWVYKRGDLYYLIFAAGPIPEHIAYATGPSATGPWTYRGVIMATEGGSFTNHPGIVEYKGRNYFFYHNGALPGGGGFTRSVCVEEFEYNEDGTIPRLRMTKEGATQIEHLNPYRRVEAETICWTEGVETEPCSEGGMCVAFVNNGDWIKVKGVDFGEAGAASFEASVASATNGGKIELRLDSVDGPLVGTLDVPATGGWQEWTTATCDVEGAQGVHDLYLKFTGGDGYLFNVDWWKFTSR